MSPRLLRRRAASSLLAIAAVIGATLSGLVGTVHAAGAATPTCPCTVFAPMSTPATVDSGDGNSGQPWDAVLFGHQRVDRRRAFLQGVDQHRHPRGGLVEREWRSAGPSQLHQRDSVRLAAGQLQLARVYLRPDELRRLLLRAQRPLLGRRWILRHDRGRHSPLHAPANSTATPNGSFDYAPGPAFPGSTFNSNNYWVDAVFNTTGPIPATPPANATATTLFSASATPGTVDSGDGNSVNLGVTFYSDTTGWISGVRFDKRRPTWAPTSAACTRPPGLSWLRPPSPTRRPRAGSR